MIRFEHIEYLYALFSFPVFILLYLLYVRHKKKALGTFGDAALLQQLAPKISKHRPPLKFSLFLAAIGLLIIAMVNPQVGAKVAKAKRKGVDLMIALDISNSMLARDIQPSRLERAKQTIQKLINQLEGDRIGIVVFAGKAFVQLPITNDYAAAKMFLDNISPQMIASQGTNIGAALKQCIASFGEENKRNRAIILISDGEDHQESALEIAEQAKGKEIQIYTIGMGSPQGAPIPLSTNSRGNFKTDKQGNVIVSKLNQKTLQYLAQKGKGIYVNAYHSSDALNIVFKEINQMEKTEYDAIVYTDYEDRFQYFIFPAILLLLLEIVLNDKKGKLFSKLNLFGNNA